jgi:hypothetical protein
MKHVSSPKKQAKCRISISFDYLQSVMGISLQVLAKFLQLSSKAICIFLSSEKIYDWDLIFVPPETVIFIQQHRIFT